MSDRRSLLAAALGFVLLENWRSVRELVILHAWLDTWSGLGVIVVGMERHGYDLWLARDRNGWRSTFLVSVGLTGALQTSQTGHVFCSMTLMIGHRAEEANRK